MYSSEPTISVTGDVSWLPENMRVFMVPSAWGRLEKSSTHQFTYWQVTTADLTCKDLLRLICAMHREGIAKVMTFSRIPLSVPHIVQAAARFIDNQRLVAIALPKSWTAATHHARMAGYAFAVMDVAFRRHCNASLFEAVPLCNAIRDSWRLRRNFQKGHAKGVRLLYAEANSPHYGLYDRKQANHAIRMFRRDFDRFLAEAPAAAATSIAEPCRSQRFAAGPILSRFSARRFAQVNSARLAESLELSQRCDASKRVKPAVLRATANAR